MPDSVYCEIPPEAAGSSSHRTVLSLSCATTFSGLVLTLLVSIPVRAAGVASAHFRVAVRRLRGAVLVYERTQHRDHEYAITSPAISRVQGEHILGPPNSRL